MRGLKTAMRIITIMSLVLSMTGGMIFMRYKDDPVVMKRLQAAAIAQYGGEDAGRLGGEVARMGEMLSFLGNTPIDEGGEGDLAAWYAADDPVEEPDTIE